MSTFDDKVVVSIFGGLGNQLFQYATGLSVARQLDALLVLDVSWFHVVHQIPGQTIRSFALKNLIADETVTICRWGDFYYPSVGLSNKAKKLVGKATRWLDGVSVYAEKGFNYDAGVFDNKSPLWLVGYWQSPHYFNSIASEIKSTIRRARLKSKNIDLYRTINECFSICVHVRRGDFLSSSSHPVQDVEYYIKGLSIIAQRVLKSQLFIFTDDPEWVRKNFHIHSSFYVVDSNGSDEADQDLLLMSACKHFVIANSTLSWWGAWLGTYPGKIVVYPKDWFNGSNKDISDLFPSDWLKA